MLCEWTSPTKLSFRRYNLCTDKSQPSGAPRTDLPIPLASLATAWDTSTVEGCPTKRLLKRWRISTTWVPRPNESVSSLHLPALIYDVGTRSLLEGSDRDGCLELCMRSGEITWNWDRFGHLLPNDHTPVWMSTPKSRKIRSPVGNDEFTLKRMDASHG